VIEILLFKYPYYQQAKCKTFLNSKYLKTNYFSSKINILFTIVDFQPTIKLSTNLEVNMSEKKPITAVTAKEEPKPEAPKAKEAAVKEAPKLEASTKESQPEEITPKPEQAKVEGAPKPKAVEPKLSDIKLILDPLTAIILDHTRQITELQEALARKRKPPASNGKVQIIDKKTGQIFPSKNNAYQTLLKSGDS